MIKYTLVPETFFSASSSEKYLSSVVEVGEGETVRYKELPEYKAVLVYSGDSILADEAAGSICQQVSAASALPKYNKVVLHQGAGCVDIVIAAGDRLLLCNSFLSSDSVTSLYYLFASLKEFQINPVVTTLHFFGDVDDAMKSDAARYFNSVEQL